MNSEGPVKALSIDEQLTQYKQLGQHNQIIQLLEPLPNETLPVHQAIALAGAWLATQQFDKAQSLYTKLMTQAPDNQWVMLGLLRSHEHDFSHQQRLKKVGEFLQQKPNNEHLVALKLRYFRLANRALEALAYIESLPNDVKSSLPVAIEQASLQRFQGDSLAARETYKSLIAEHPKHKPSYMGLLDVEITLQRFAKTIDLCDEALKQFPDDPQIQLRKAQCLLRLKEYHKSLQIYDSIPGNQWAVLGSVECLQALNPEQASEYLAQNFDDLSASKELGVRNTLSRLASKDTNPDIQLVWIEWFLKDNSSAAIANLLSAIALLQELGRLDDCLQLIQQAAKQPLNNPKVALRIIETCSKLTDEETTNNLLEDLLAQQDDGTRHAIEALLRFKSEGALATLDHLDLTKTNYDPLIFFDVYHSAGQLAQLYDHAQRRSTLTTSQHARCLIKLGHADEALALLESLIEQTPEEIELASEAYYLLGRYDECLSALDKIYSYHFRLHLEFRAIACIVEMGIDESPLQRRFLDRIAERLKTPRANTLHTRVLKEFRAKSANSVSFSEAVRAVLTLYQANVNSTSNTPPPSSEEIPRNIVQYWNALKIPNYIQDVTRTWEGQPDFDYQLFNIFSAKQFIRAHFSKRVVAAFTLCQHAAEQADLFRLCYLVAKGGWYADVDDMLTGDLATIYADLPQTAGLVLLKDPYGVGNNIIGAKPNHPVLIAALERAISFLLQRNQDIIWMKTGPGLLIQCLGEYLLWLEKHKQDSDVTILSPQQVIPTIKTHTSLPYKSGKMNWTKFISPGTERIDNQPKGKLAGLARSRAEQSVNNGEMEKKSPQTTAVDNETINRSVELNHIKTFTNINIVPYIELLTLHRGGPVWPDEEWSDDSEVRHRQTEKAADAKPTSVDAELIVEERLFWCGAIQRHFGHQIADFSSRILDYKGMDGKYCFAVHPRDKIDGYEKTPRFFKEIVEHLGVSKDNIFIVTHPILARELLVAPQNEMLGGEAPSDDYIEKLSRNYPATERNNTEGIYYISRAAMKTGRIAGESYFEHLFGLNGVKVIRPETISLAEQLRIYSTARILVFAEGSALHTLRLLGKIHADVFILRRRTDCMISLSSIAKRVLNIKVINLGDVVYGLNSSFNEVPWLGICVPESNSISEIFKHIGKDLKSVDVGFFKSCIANDVHEWVIHEQASNRDSEQSRQLIDSKINDILNKT